MKENWYDKFNRKSEVADSKNKRKEFNKERDKFFEAKRRKATNKAILQDLHIEDQHMH